MNRIILNKRKEMLDIINKFYEKDELYDALDIENKENASKLWRLVQEAGD